MIRKASISIMIVSLIAFAGGLVGSLSAQSSEPATEVDEPTEARPPWCRGLGVSRELLAGIDARDPTFADDLARMRGELADSRRALADALAADDTTDGQIREHVEAVIATHNTLERRVTDYLLIVRHELPPQQRGRLFSIMAEGVRGGCGRGWGMGKGRGQGRGCAPGCQHGEEDCPKAGVGKGRGQRARHRGGHGGG